jgi:hypothetical protein
MKEKISIFFFGMICSATLIAQDYRYDIHGNRVKCATQDFDNLYHHLPYIQNYKDSIKFYEDAIRYKIIALISTLQPIDTSNKEDPKTLIYYSLMDYKGHYQKTLKSLSNLCYFSFGKITIQKGEISALFYLQELKANYYYLEAMGENICVNFFN